MKDANDVVSIDKPFCTKDGIEVTDDITFDDYVKENSPEDTAAAAPTTVTTNGDAKLTKHSIYILTKKRAKKLDPSVDTFYGKSLDLSNVRIIQSFLQV